MRPAALVLLLSSLASAAAAPPPAVEFVAGTGAGAVVIGLAVEIDGRPSGERWAAATAAMFADADLDANGTLDKAEAGRVLSALRVRQLGWGYLWAVPQAADWKDLDADRDSVASREELAAYYRRHAADGPQIGVGQATSATALTAALRKQLDANGNGRMTDDEWAAAADALRPLDRDEDELIRPPELVANVRYPGSTGGLMLTANAAAGPLRRLPVGGTAGRPATARTVEVRLSATDPDGVDVAWADGPAGLRVAAYPAPSPVLGAFAAARVLATERFTAADADRDGSLDAAEVKSAGYAPITDHLAFADRDGDGRLSRAEWQATLAVRAKLIDAAVTVTVVEHRRGLFEALDADLDGALSVRELRNARQRLTALGCLKDGQVVADAVPTTVRLVVSRGRPETLLSPIRRAGPGWFRAMDRNRDGDVSRKEFVGPADAFHELDANADGLVSPAEAARKK